MGVFKTFLVCIWGNSNVLQTHLLSELVEIVAAEWWSIVGARLVWNAKTYKGAIDSWYNCFCGRGFDYLYGWVMWSGLLEIGPNKSTRMWCQGPFKSSVIVNGSSCFVFTGAWHGRHPSRIFWTLLLMLGNQSWLGRYYFVLTSPWCLSCAAWAILSRRLSDTIILCMLIFTLSSWKTCL